MDISLGAFANGTLLTFESSQASTFFTQRRTGSNDFAELPVCPDELGVWVDLTQGVQVPHVLEVLENKASSFHS